MASQKFAPSQTVTFNVSSDSYTTFISTLRGALAGTKPDKVRDRPVLAKQTGETAQPPRWIHVVLNAGDGGAAPKVAIRSDNAYIAGFANRPKGSTEDVWFQLSPRGSTQLFKGAKMLGFNGHYSTLVGGDGVKDLPNLKLGKERTLEAASVLWNYKQDKLMMGCTDTAVGADPQQNLKRKLALLAVTLCEAARLDPVRAVIDGGWKRELSITNKEVGYIGDWSDLSTALLAWKADKFSNDTKHFSKFAGIGISDGNAALAVVQLLLNKPPKKGFLAWLKHLWGLLVRKNNSQQMQQEEKQYEQQKPAEKGKIRRGPKSSSVVNPL